MDKSIKKTLAECRKDTAEAYGYENWSHLQKQLIFRNEDVETFIHRLDEAAELYASQFKQSEPVSADVEKASDKFIAFVKTKYKQRDHNTIYLFDKMLDAIYQSVLNGLIDECFGNQSQQPLSIAWMSDEEISMEEYKDQELAQQQETIAELKNQLDGIKKQRQDDMSLANAAVIEIAELRKEVEWLRNEHADSSKRDAELKKQNDELMEVVKKANALIESLKLRITQHVDIKRRDRSLGLSLELFRDELNKIESYQNTPPKN